MWWGLDAKVPEEAGKASPDLVMEVGSTSTKAAYKLGGLAGWTKKCGNPFTLSRPDPGDKST